VRKETWLQITSYYSVSMIHTMNMELHLVKLVLGKIIEQIKIFIDILLQRKILHRKENAQVI